MNKNPFSLRRLAIAGAGVIDDGLRGVVRPPPNTEAVDDVVGRGLERGHPVRLELRREDLLHTEIRRGGDEGVGAGLVRRADPLDLQGFPHAVQAALQVLRPGQPVAVLDDVLDVVDIREEEPEQLVDTDDLDGETKIVESECGCSSPGASPKWMWLIGVFALIRRRRQL